MLLCEENGVSHKQVRNWNDMEAKHGMKREVKESEQKKNSLSTGKGLESLYT